MCRLLYIKSKKPFPVLDHLQIFAAIAKNSKEYQGHGWGMAFLQNGKWQHYKNINPVWKDNLGQFGHTTLMLVHARSAFQDRDIIIENNMPFYDQRYIFIFNGELHGVKIKAAGRIGAEKVFNFIRHLDRGDMTAAMIKGVDIIEKRSSYIRAMNIIIADREAVYVSSVFNEDEDYFTMYYKKTKDELIICSEKYPAQQDAQQDEQQEWIAIKNRSVKVYR